MSLMLINPKHRAKRRSNPRHRSAAQRAATARMLAANRARRGHNPKRRRHAAHRRHNPVGLHRVRSNVMHHIRRRRHRNPISTGGAVNLLINGAIGAVGIVGVNAVTSMLPATVNTGRTLYATRAVLALVIGTVGRAALGDKARAAAEGVLAANFADLIVSLTSASLPGAGLHGIGAYLSSIHMNQQLPYANSGFPSQPAHLDRELDGMGEYLAQY
ncbi:MAG: hypothetical protein ACHP7O_11655 [Burkholderiales bacterium]